MIPVAERAIETGSPDALIALLGEAVREAVQQRFDHLMHLRDHPPGDVARAREYVEAMLGLQVYSHQLYQAVHADPHAAHHEHWHG